MPTIFQSDKSASAKLGTAVSYGLVVPAYLDDFTFSACWSLRQLRRNYLGPCLRARNETTGAIGDVAFAVNAFSVTTASLVTVTTAGTSGFSIGQIVTLATFAGANDVALVRWYDQSGNNRSLGNAEGGTTLHPKLMVAGAFQSLNSRPYVACDGVNDRLDSTVASGGPAAWIQAQPSTVVAAGIVAPTGNSIFWDRKQQSLASTAGQFEAVGGGVRRIFAGVSMSDGLVSTENGKARCYGAVYNGAASSIWVDGVQVGATGNAGTNVAEDFRLGVSWNNGPVANRYWEALVLASTGDAAAVSARVMAYYGLA